MNVHIGRPRDLSFMRGLQVVLAWDKKYHALARREAVGKLRLRTHQKKIARLRRSGGSIFEIARLSRQMDLLGRVHEVRLYKPKTLKPVIDRQIAKELGVSEPMVRKVRGDPRYDPFRATPPWEVRAWEEAARQEAVARRIARALMTPERLAKGEPVLIRKGALWVPTPERRQSIARLDKSGQWYRVYFGEFEYVSELEREIIPGPAPKGARCSF